MPVSAQRFSSLKSGPDGLQVTVSGAVGEHVSVMFAYMRPKAETQVRTFVCVLMASGRAVVSSNGTCRAVGEA